MGTTFAEAASARVDTAAVVAVPATSTDVASATAGDGSLCLVYRDCHGFVYLLASWCHLSHGHHPVTKPSRRPFRIRRFLSSSPCFIARAFAQGM